MTSDETSSPYAIALADLERGVRVPLGEQVTELRLEPTLNPEVPWNEWRRELRLSGGA